MHRMNNNNIKFEGKSKYNKKKEIKQKCRLFTLKFSPFDLKIIYFTVTISLLKLKIMSFTLKLK